MVVGRDKQELKHVGKGASTLETRKSSAGPMADFRGGWLIQFFFPICSQTGDGGRTQAHSVWQHRLKHA